MPGQHAFTHTDGTGDEAIQLPTIVENVESSPAAAQAAATAIRKLLDVKQPPPVQYQAIMLLRILTDNPGESFTRFIGSDNKYSGQIKDLIRRGVDSGVWGILRETLVHFEGEKEHDPGLQKVREMWVKEKKLIEQELARSGGQGVIGGYTNQNVFQMPGAPHADAASRHHRHRSQRRPKVPPPMELASRISEATSTANLLTQLLNSTPQNELINHELISEFAERCRLAQKSIAGYISAAEEENVDVDTLATLIETHDVVAKAVLAWKKQLSNAQKRQKAEQTNVMMTGAAPAASTVSSQTDAPAAEPNASGMVGRLTDIPDTSSFEPAGQGYGQPVAARQEEMPEPPLRSPFEEPEEVEKKPSRAGVLSADWKTKKRRTPPPPPVTTSADTRGDASTVASTVSPVVSS